MKHHVPLLSHYTRKHSCTHSAVPAWLGVAEETVGDSHLLQCTVNKIIMMVCTNVCRSGRGHGADTGFKRRKHSSSNPVTR